MNRGLARWASLVGLLLAAGWLPAWAADEVASAPCVDPPVLPASPPRPPDLPETECSVCRDLLDEYRELLTEHTRIRLEVAVLREQARDLHERVESTCRNVRALESSGVPVPEDLRQSLVERIRDLDAKVVAVGDRFRDLEANIAALEALAAEFADCEERLCGKVFEAPGSGGIVRSPSPVEIVELGDYPRQETLDPLATECPACQEAVDLYNGSLEGYNETVASLNDLMARLDAVKAVLTELLELPSGDETNRQIEALQSRGKDLEVEIRAGLFLLGEWRTFLGIGEGAIQLCEAECDTGGFEVPDVGGLEPTAVLIEDTPSGSSRPFDPRWVTTTLEEPAQSGPPVIFEVEDPRTPSGACGNGAIDRISEDCDGHDLAGKSCADWGFLGGTLGCGSDCKFDLTSCHRCGDGVADPTSPSPAGPGGEECDGDDFIGATCALFGFDSGELRCTAQCKTDSSGCFDAPTEAPPVLVVSPDRLFKQHVRGVPCPDPFPPVALRNDGGGEIRFRVTGEVPLWLDLQTTEGAVPGELRPRFTCQVPPGDQDLTVGLDLRPIDAVTGEPVGPPVTLHVAVEVRSP